MHKTKLIRTLSTLSSDDWSSFRKFLLMHTRKGSDNFDFFEFLQLRKDKLSKMIDADIIREKHFSQLSSKGFSNMMSRIFNWLEEWLVIDEFKKQRYQQEIMLIKAYNRKGLYKLADSNIKKLENSLKKETALSIEKNKILSELYHAQYYSDNPIKYTDGSKIIEKHINYFQYYIKDSLSSLIPELHNIGRIQNHNLDHYINICHNVLKSIPDSELSPYLSHLEKIVVSNDVNSLKVLFKAVVNDLFKEDSFIHTVLVYYLMGLSLQLWIKGKLKSTKIIGEIYDYAINSGVLLMSNKIPKRRFHNVISTLGGIKPMEWMINFIDKHYQKIDSKNPINSKNLAYAQTYFHNKKYGKILDAILQSEFDDFDLKVRSICLHAIALYKEKDLNFDILDNRLSNFKRLLSRHKNKVSKKYFLSHYNFIDVISLLSQRSFKNIEIDLSKYEYLTNRKWVIEELKNKKARLK